MKIFIFSLFFLSLFAFSAKPVEIFSAADFSSAALFDALDSAGGGGTWMEWDDRGVLDPELAKFLLNRDKSIRKNVKHAWLLSRPDKTFLLAVLSQRKSGESLSFHEIGGLSTAKVPLRLEEPLNPETVFRDYKETRRGHFVHFDDSNLQVDVRENEIQFSYLKPDGQALSPVSHFERLPEHQKRQEIQMRKDFYAYEYSLMVQAFIASTRGIFNWQIWHWLSAEWTDDAKIGDREIAALLSLPDQGKFVRIFYKTLPGGASVEMLSNAHGSFLMHIRKR